MDKVYLSFNDICLIFISFFFPPLTVLIKKGCGSDFCINLLLSTLLLFFGTFHAIYIVFRENESYSRIEEQDNENNTAATNIPDNAIVVILPGANVNTNSNNIPNNLPPPSYAESEQIAKEQKEFLYPELPTYEATSSSGEAPEQKSTHEKH